MAREHRECPGIPDIRLSPVWLDQRQKAREVYSNHLGHAMLVSASSKYETLVLQRVTMLIVISFDSLLPDRYPIGVDFVVSGLISWS